MTKPPARSTRDPASSGHSTNDFPPTHSDASTNPSPVKTRAPRYSTISLAGGPASPTSTRSPQAAIIGTNQTSASSSGLLARHETFPSSQFICPPPFPPRPCAEGIADGGHACKKLSAFQGADEARSLRKRNDLRSCGGHERDRRVLILFAKISELSRTGFLARKQWNCAPEEGARHLLLAHIPDELPPEALPNPLGSASDPVWCRLRTAPRLQEEVPRSSG